VLPIAVVTAVAAERDAVARGAGVSKPAAVGPYDAIAGTTAGGDAITIVAGGVGPAAAASAAMACALGGAELLVSMGVGGLYGPSYEACIVVADRMVAADLGAMTATGFADIETLGLGSAAYDSDKRSLAHAVEQLADVLPVRVGPVLTVATVTGTEERAADLSAAHAAVAEAMEGYAVAHVGAITGLPVIEIRSASNRVGARDRDGWNLAGALADLTAAAAALFGGQWPV
jgi:futalosine hydrolase